MNLSHYLERRYCSLHPDLAQPAPGRCLKCGMPLQIDASVSGAVHRVVEWPGMLYVMVAVMCVLILAIAALGR